MIFVANPVHNSQLEHFSLQILHERIVFSLMDIFQLNLNLLRTVSWNDIKSELFSNFKRIKMIYFLDGHRNHYILDDFHTIYTEGGQSFKMKLKSRHFMVYFIRFVHLQIRTLARFLSSINKFALLLFRSLPSFNITRQLKELDLNAHKLQTLYLFFHICFMFLTPVACIVSNNKRIFWTIYFG